MKFTHADQIAILTGTGGPITIGTTGTVGKFKAAGKLVEMYGGGVTTTGPLLLLSETDAATVTENSTTITIDAVAYQATQKLPDGSGFVELELTKDF